MSEPAVADLMTRQVIAVVPDTPFRELVGTMLAHDLHTLPVIDLTGRPIGIVTDVDTLTKLEYHGGADYPPLLAGARRRTRWRKASGINAADLMTTSAPTVTADTPISTALHTLADADHVYVVDNDGRLTGTLTRRDVSRSPAASSPSPAPSAYAAPPTTSAGSPTATPGVTTVHNNLRHDIDDSLITGL